MDAFTRTLNSNNDDDDDGDDDDFYVIDSDFMMSFQTDFRENENVDDNSTIHLTILSRFNCICLLVEPY